MVRRAKNPLERSPAGGAQLRLPPGIPHPIDIHVGARLRTRRTLCAFTQEALARAVGLTFQQIQKYERGTNRIGASRLFQFAKVLSVPVGYFFSDLDDRLGDPRAGYEIGLMLATTGMPSTVAENRRETIELIRAFNRIGDPRLRSAVQRMAEFLALAATGTR